MRIAKSVSHQNFERILHFLRGVCLLECLFIPTNLYLFDTVLLSTASKDVSEDETIQKIDPALCQLSGREMTS